MNKILIKAQPWKNVFMTVDNEVRHKLNIDLKFDGACGDIKEVSVSIYSTEFVFRGSRKKIVEAGKHTGTLRMIVNSERKWMGGLYYAFVYVDGVVKGVASLNLLNMTGKQEWTPLCDVSEEADIDFFIREVACSKWGEYFMEVGFDQKYNLFFLRKMMRLKAERMDENANPCRALFVSSDYNLEGMNFSKNVLGSYLAGEDHSKVCKISLSDVLYGYADWQDVSDMIKQHQVIVIDLARLETGRENLSIVAMFCDIISQDIYADKQFIFCSYSSVIRALRANSESFAAMNRGYNDFCLIFPDDYLQDDGDEDEDDEDLDIDLDVKDELDFSVDDDDDDDDDDELDTSDGVGNEFSSLVERILNGSSHEAPEEPKKPVDTVDPEQKLMSMVGLSRVKQEIMSAKTMAQFYKRRLDMGLANPSEYRNHFIFYGSPGTGKTTVARLIGDIYKEMGILSKGHTVETNRAQLVGEYIGSTEKNVKEVIEQARGGVLFIDEAYALYGGEDNPRDFGKEVLNALLTVLSEPNPDMIIILAGYEDKMNTLLKFNSGLEGRFPLRIHFDDYTADELMTIAQNFIADGDFALTDAAAVRLRQLIETAVSCKDEHFENGRWVHNLIEHKVLPQMAARVMASAPADADKSLLSTIEECDIIAVEAAMDAELTAKVKPLRRLGFAYS